MKNLFRSIIAVFVFAAIMSAFFSSCDKEQIVPFDIEFLNVPISVGPLVSPNGNEVFFTKVFLTETEQKLNEYGASFDDIESAKLKTLKLRIANPPIRNFDPIDFVEAWAFATGVDTIKVAYTDPIPDEGLKEVEFNSQYSDLSELVKQDDFSFFVQGYHNAPLADSTHFELDFVITVKVKTKK
jgi:hypothetical protein